MAGKDQMFSKQHKEPKMAYSPSSSSEPLYFSAWEPIAVYGNDRQIMFSVEYARNTLLGKTVLETTDWVLTVVTSIYC